MAGTFDSCSPVDPLCSYHTVDTIANGGDCSPWLDAGHNCLTTWNSVCSNDLPFGAEYNGAPWLSYVNCTQCGLNLCSGAIYCIALWDSNPGLADECRMYHSRASTRAPHTAQTTGCPPTSSAWRGSMRATTARRLGAMYARTTIRPAPSTTRILFQRLAALSAPRAAARPLRSAPRRPTRD